MQAYRSDLPKIKNSFGVPGSSTKIFKDNYWYKIDSFKGEGENEYLASEILKCSDLQHERYVVYEKSKVYLNEVLDYDGCKSKNFLKDNEEVIYFSSCISDVETAYKTFPDLMNAITTYSNEHFNVDILPYLQGCYTIDAIIHNTDRHLGNINLIHNKVTNEYRYAPLFDFGRAFHPLSIYEVTKPLENFYKTVKPKYFPEDSFISQCKYLGLGFHLYYDKLIDHLRDLDVAQSSKDLISLSISDLKMNLPDIFI